MRAITIWQPWAILLAYGRKKNETRSRNTNVRGIVAIHSAKKPIEGVIHLLDDEVIKLSNKLLYPLQLSQLHLGCILGTGNLVDCILIDEKYLSTLSREEILLGDYTLGRYAWIFEDVKPLSFPIQAKGSQGFWNWEYNSK